MVHATLQGAKRRLIPIVDRRFQFKYTGAVLAVAAFVALVLGAFLWRSYVEMNEVIEIVSLTSFDPETSKQVHAKLESDDARKVFRLTIAVLLGSVALFGVIGLLITHRVVGPVVVLHRHLATLLDGHYPHLRSLRHGDEFREAFEVFMAYVEQLKRRDEDELVHLKEVLQRATQKGLAPEDLALLQRMVDERAARLEPRA